MIKLYEGEVRAITGHMSKLYGYTDELVSAQDALSLRRALAGMEESAALLLVAVRCLVHRAESLR